MFIRDLVNADELPALEHAMRFAAQRQRLIAHNIANIDTPDFRPVGVSIGDFQSNLAKAVDERREAWGGTRGDLEWSKTPELGRDEAGRLRLRPVETGRNALFHDRNTRDLERLMQDLQENASAFRMATQLMRNKMDLLGSAIRESA